MRKFVILKMLALGKYCFGSYALMTPPKAVSASITRADHAASSSSRSVRSCDWKTQRSNSA